MARPIDYYHLEVLAFLGGETNPVHFGRIMQLNPRGLEAAFDLVVRGMVDRSPRPDMANHAVEEDWYSLNDRGRVFLNLVLDYAS